ncbi:MAG: CvpA family protein [Candidatus Latescibacteria bacterium]|nr:CvpA family protein [Candidatus Latescibacterota bacterium]
MNWIDIAIVATLLYQGTIGFRHGFWHGLMDLSALVVAITITTTQFVLVSQIILESASVPPIMANWIGFLGCFGVSSLILEGFVYVGKRFIPPARSDWTQKATGLFLGSVRGILLVSFLLMIFSLLPMPVTVSNRLEQSPLAPSAFAVVPLLFDGITDSVQPNFRPLIDHLSLLLTFPTTESSEAAAVSNNQVLEFIRGFVSEER